MDRISCLIVGCRRTCKNNAHFSEWICQKHWGAVPKKYRRLYAMAKRKYKRGSVTQERVWGIWDKCKDQAFMNAWCV